MVDELGHMQHDNHFACGTMDVGAGSFQYNIFLVTWYHLNGQKCPCGNFTSCFSSMVNVGLDKFIFQFISLRGKMKGTWHRISTWAFAWMKAYGPRLNRLRAKCFRGNIKHIFTFYVIPPHWYDTGTSNPFSSKQRAYIFYIVNIMAVDVLAT